MPAYENISVYVGSDDKNLLEQVREISIGTGQKFSPIFWKLIEIGLKNQPEWESKSLGIKTLE